MSKPGRAKKRTFVLCHCGRRIQRRVGPGDRAPYSGRALLRSNSRHGRVWVVGVWCDVRTWIVDGLEDGSVMAGDDAGGFFFGLRWTSSTRADRAKTQGREYPNESNQGQSGGRVCR
jgi:hypothetical protein